MLINFFSLDNMYSTFCNMYGIEEGKLREFLEKYDEARDTVSQFCDYFEFKLDAVDVSGNELLCRHFTTAIDAGESIEKNGLMSLKELLSKETVFKRFLTDNGIVIDINRMTFKFKDNPEVSFAEDDCPFHSKLKYLLAALNHDNGELEAFYRGSFYEMYNYSTVRNYPEILRKIDDAIGELYGMDEKCLASNWIKCVDRRMMIEFTVELSNMTYCRGVDQVGMGRYDAYMLEDYDYNSYPWITQINRWLIRSILNCLIKNDVSHICGFLGVKNPKLINNLKLIDINDEESNG